MKNEDCEGGILVYEENGWEILTTSHPNYEYYLSKQLLKYGEEAKLELETRVRNYEKSLNKQ